MKVLGFLLTLALLAVGLLVLLPVLSIGVALLVSGGFFLIWLLPIFIIAASDRTSGGEKIAWILAIIFLSWFAWIFYFFLAPLKPRSRDSGRYRQRDYGEYGGDYRY